MKIALNYGKSQRDLSIPEKARVSLLSPSAMPGVKNVEDVFDKTMDSPLGGQSLETMNEPRSGSTISRWICGLFLELP